MTEFGLSKDKNIFKKYIGEYIIIYPYSSNTSFAGLLVDIQEGYGILNPYHGSSYTKDGLINKIVEKDAMVNLFNINGIVPITKEDLENFCEVSNKPNHNNK